MTLRDIRYQAAIVVDGRLLLLRCEPHRGEAYWLLPGGGREPDESETECVAREVLEEAGVHVDVVGVLYDIPAQPSGAEFLVDPYLAPQLHRIRQSFTNLWPGA